MAPIELRIQLDAEAEPISGCLCPHGELGAVQFAGWVEFVQAIERVRGSSRAAHGVSASELPIDSGTPETDESQRRQRDG